VLGQAHPPLVRIFGIAVAAFAILALPAFAGSSPLRSAAALRAENAQLAAKSRSAVLDLYSLDARLAAAQAHLSSVLGQLGALRAERATLRHELTIARGGELTSEHQLAARLRQLYDQGEVSPIEVVFGATSITDAMTQLDNIHRVASLNDAVLAELHSARPGS
jgi:peptidoglycan hydrolase CwlO-like protein